MGLFTPNDGRRERFETLTQTIDLGLKQLKRTAAALQEIRDEQLYRVAFSTFDECCKAKWNITADYADRLIDFENFCNVLPPTVQPPANERQYRALKSLPVEERVAAWTDAQADGGTGAAITTAIAKRKPRLKKAKTLKALRLKVPGGTVVITPNRKGKDYSTMLEFARQILSDREQREAA